MIYDITKNAVSTDLLNGVKVTGYGNVLTCESGVSTVAFQAVLSGTSGALTAVVELYGSNDPVILNSVNNAALLLLNTFTLSGTGGGVSVKADTLIWNVDMPYKYFVGRVTSISGTGATVNVYVSAN